MRLMYGRVGPRFPSIGIALVLIAAAPLASNARPSLAKLNGITIQGTAGALQVSILTSAVVGYQLRKVRADWVVIDVLGTELGIPSGSIPAPRSAVKRIRVGQYTPEVVRVVVELVQPMAFHITTSSHNMEIIIGLPADATIANSPIEHAWAGTDMPRAQSQPWTVIPGERIGAVRLGMDIQETSRILGPSVSRDLLTAEGGIYRWLKLPENIGLAVWTTKTGTVQRIWVLNDSRFGTQEHIRIGSTETDVRAAYGDPSWTATTESQEKKKSLTYDALGVWFSIQLEEGSKLYGVVFEIGVMPRKRGGI